MFFNQLTRLKYLFFNVQNDWEIGFKKENLDNLSYLNLENIKWVKMPKNVYYADPFIFIKNHRYYIFFEEFLRDKNYGVISYIELDKNFDVINKKIVIDERIHFSYPNIFENEGQIYMIPESESKRTLSLYLAVEFPTKWKEIKTILKFGCSDPELFKFENKWHLLYTKTKNNNELFLRINDNLKDGWSSCKEYKILTGPNSRNGGKIFSLNKKIYRVSQNCETRYGEEILVNEILNLSNINYKEKLVRQIKPDLVKGICVHTLNFKGEIFTIDRLRERIFFKRPLEIFSKLKTKIIN